MHKGKIKLNHPVKIPQQQGMNLHLSKYVTGRLTLLELMAGLAILGILLTWIFR